MELATEVFAEEGYAAVSVRDLARRSSLTTGANYAHFLNKAELLVEAIDARVATDVETAGERPEISSETTSPTSTAGSRAGGPPGVLIEGRPARNDAAVRERLTAEQGDRVRSWVAEYEAAQAEASSIPVDMRRRS